MAMTTKKFNLLHSKQIKKQYVEVYYRILISALIGKIWYQDRNDVAPILE